MRRIVKPPDWLLHLLIAITLLIIAAIYLFKNTVHGEGSKGYRPLMCGGERNMIQMMIAEIPGGFRVEALAHQDDGEVIALVRGIKTPVGRKIQIGSVMQLSGKRDAALCLP
jgi:hypothetical protein